MVTPVKILQITSVYETVQHLLLPLINRLQNNGFCVESVCSPSKYTDELRSKGYVIYSVCLARNFSILQILKSIKHLFHLIQKNKYHIVHVHSPVSAIVGRIAAKLAGVKVIIYTVHGFYFHEYMPRLDFLFYYFIEKYMARFLTDFMFFQSEEDYELANKKNFLKSQKLVYIGNGVDVIQKFNPQTLCSKKLDELRHELQIMDNNIIITFIGRLVYEKGILDLLNAFLKINDENIYLLILGSALSTDRDSIKEEDLAQIRVDTRIKFLGFRHDIPEVLAITDIYCMPSYREGKPRSIIEAMAMECAIIASNIRGCREEVIENYNGFLFEIKNINDLVVAVNKLISNPQLLKKYKQYSRILAQEQYDERIVLDKQMIIFDRLKNELINI